LALQYKEEYVKKNFLFVLVVLILTGIIPAWAGGKSASVPASSAGELPKTDRLVIYSNTAESFVNYAVPAFEAKYGVKVEIISANGGEILNRIKAEKDNPIADIVLGGGKSTFGEYLELFDPYVSPEVANIEDVAKDPDGYFTAFEISCQPLLINRSVVGNVEIRGYADLLKPELYKKVVLGDAAKSNSALVHLLQILDGYAILEGKRHESDSAWNYVGELLKHSVLLQSSGNIHKAVADGEYGVALTWEAPAITYLQDGAKNLEIVYPRECMYFGPSSVQIVHGGKNKRNARLFVDFVLSEEVQKNMGMTTSSRPTRKNVQLASYFTPYSGIEQVVGKNLFVRPDDFIIPNTARIQKKFTDVMTEVLE
jgi:iron(III) transport system substrate-binding protein